MSSLQDLDRALDEIYQDNTRVTRSLNERLNQIIPNEYQQAARGYIGIDFIRQLHRTQGLTPSHNSESPCGPWTVYPDLPVVQSNPEANPVNRTPELTRGRDNDSVSCIRDILPS